MKGDKECEEHNCEYLKWCRWHPDECMGKPWKVWRKARKKPVVVEFREPEPNGEHFDGEKWVKAEFINTLEGTLVAVLGRDYVIRGVNGELYPIRKDIFNQTYEVIEEEASEG